MRVAPPVTLDCSQRETLQQWARSRSLPARQIERARVVLLAAEGKTDLEIATGLHISNQKAARWRKRFGAVLDPTIRTGKVRIEVHNPGMMRLGMFVRATFQGQTRETHTVVPASAVMHMHDRDWVFVPTTDGKFRRLEVVSGDLLPDNTSLQEVKAGLQPGQQVVTNALVLDHVLAQ